VALGLSNCLGTDVRRLGCLEGLILESQSLQLVLNHTLSPFSLYINRKRMGWKDGTGVHRIQRQ
jgi:hypothetical protein